jgi:hypothetical protein
MDRIALLLLFLSLTAHAAPGDPKSGTLPVLALGQGISSPDSTSPVNLTNGNLYTNPAGGAELGRPYLAGQVATGGGKTGFGAEGGYASGSAGLAAGYFKPDCSGCGVFGVLGGVGLGALDFGIGYHDGAAVSIGTLLRPKGPHRFGFAVDVGTSGQPTSVGGGYSFVSQQVMFAVDVSRPVKNGGSATQLTPGIEISADMFAFSLDYDTYLGNKGSHSSQFWFGAGVNLPRLHIALYHNYVSDWTVTVAFRL